MGNCTGCFLKSEKTRAWICKNKPDDRDWWIEMEKKAKSTFTKDRSWKDLNNFAQRQGDFNLTIMINHIAIALLVLAQIFKGKK